ncbi:ornithine cyclodeaminase family protein [Bradyrhizobium ottawaense]|uniref:ornithine cyclodeaminase family protein n=1 Tax=Bradyrhizobium ottawaense TaxID=931866 RepID=UPI0015CF2E28|nr:ornithine cyclodeaminase family protein [Bradyrhizobium ottawaense]
MSPDLLYLSNEHVQKLRISAHEAREAVFAAFRDHAAGRNIGLPKSTIRITNGSFISMSSASKVDGIAVAKWVSVVPIEGHQLRSRINGLVCVSDFGTGVPIAVLDGNSITQIRTAAMSTAAAFYLAPVAPTTIGLIGCGLQAQAHLDAFVELYPSVRRIHLLSRSVSSAERIAAATSEKQLKPIVSTDPDKLLRDSDIVVSMVPSSSDLKPFLDARLLQHSSFASAVDGGRSWRSETLSSFDRLVTDSLEQSRSPVDASNRPVECISYQEDLGRLASGSLPVRSPIRALFGFRGFVIADLALAQLAVRKARERGLGMMLSR